MKFPVVGKVTFGHMAGSVGLTSIAWFAVTGEVLKDLAALGSVLVSVAALSPAVKAWFVKLQNWIESKL